MKRIRKSCLTCSAEFEAPLREHQRGNAKYCSLRCSANRPRDRRPNRSCVHCGKHFYAPPSQRRARLVFCGKPCATRHLWKTNPPKAATGVSNYRSIALAAHGARCNRCGFDDCVDILEAHHRDVDRRNNEPDNLEVLCPTCHRLEHYRNKTGPWEATRVSDLLG